MKQSDESSRRRGLKASSMFGMAMAFRPKTIGEAFADSEVSKLLVDGNAIRPFQVKFPEAQMVDLRRRINSTKRPEGGPHQRTVNVYSAGGA